MCTHVCTHTYVYTYMHVCVHTGLYVYVYVYIQACMYVCIHKHTYTHTIPGVLFLFQTITWVHSALTNTQAIYLRLDCKKKKNVSVQAFEFWLTTAPWTRLNFQNKSLFLMLGH